MKKINGVPCAEVGHADDDDFDEKVKKLLLFRKVVHAEVLGEQLGKLVLDNGVELYVEGNQGCGGCGNGWYWLEELNTCPNAITNVSCTTSCNMETYHIFVYAENQKINLVEFTGGDNGYYGTGYHLYVRIKEAAK